MLKLYLVNNNKLRLKANGIFTTDAQSLKQASSQHPFSIFRQNIAADSGRYLTTTPQLKGEIQQSASVPHNNSIAWYQSQNLLCKQLMDSLWNKSWVSVLTVELCSVGTWDRSNPVKMWGNRMMRRHDHWLWSSMTNLAQISRRGENVKIKFHLLPMKQI